MNRSLSQRRHVVVALALTLAAGTSPSLAQTPPPTGTLHGTVTDTRHHPLADAVVSADGASGSSRVAHADTRGSYELHLNPGIYDITVRRGGYQTVDAGDVTILSGVSVALDATLADATTSNLHVIGSVSTHANAPNSAVSSVSSLPPLTIADRQAFSLQGILPEVPGVTFSRGESADPYEYFAVRGALTETRVELDGHPLSLGSSGKWNADQVDPLVFGDVDTFKGAGIDGADAGESVFGTINLRTRDFTPTNQAEVGIGVDEYGSQDSTYAISGNLERLSYVLNYNVAGQNGPENGIVANEVAVDPNDPTKAIVAFQQPLDDAVREMSELAKLRYRFSDATAAWFGFVGFQGTQNPQGIAYGTSVGAVQLEPYYVPPGASSTDPSQWQYTAPSAQNLDGHVVTGYQWYPGTTTAQNEPFFEGEFRTTYKNDTILIRPYTGVVTRIVDGNQEALYPDGQFGLTWSLVTDPTTCSSELPCYPDGGKTNYTSASNPCGTQACYQPQYDYAYDETEVNRLHGTTFSWLHPYGDTGVLNFTYDYHSDFTYDDYGDPDPADQNGTISGNAYEIAVAPTTARTNDFGLSTELNVTPKLKLAAGEYLTGWDLDYLVEDPTVIAANPGTDITDLPIALVPRGRAVWHQDPHLALNYRPSENVSLRFSVGSGITVPYASQVSGLPSVTNPSGTTNGEAVLANVNPDLDPETTVAYDFGGDFSYARGSLLSADLFDDTIHNAFILSTYPVTAPPLQGGAQRPYQLESQWFNGPIERMYGIELALKSPESARVGYYASTTFERAYYDQLPESFYTSGPSDAINGEQIAGDSQIPFAQAHAELRYRVNDATRFIFGSDYTGSNNWTYGPAFTTFFAALRHEISTNTTLYVDADNLFDYTNGNPYGIAIQNGGFSTNLVGPNPNGPGLVASSQSEPLQSIPPRTIRLGIAWHL